MFFCIYINKKSSSDGNYLHRMRAHCTPHQSLFDNDTLLSSTEEGSWNLAKPKLNLEILIVVFAYSLLNA